MTRGHRETLVPDLVTQSGWIAQGGSLGGRRARTDAIPVHHPQRVAPVAPAAMPHDRGGIEQAHPARPRHPPRRIRVLRGREAGAGAEFVVEPADALDRAAPARQVRTVTQPARVGSCVYAARRCRRLRRQPLAGSFGEHPAEDIADVGRGEGTLDCSCPVRCGRTVVVGERDEGTVGGAPAEVARSAQSRRGRSYDVCTRLRRNHAEAGVHRRRVDDNELVLRTERPGDGEKCAAQQLHAVTRADDDGDATTVARVRALVVSAWPPWWLTDGSVWLLHHHLRILADRHDVTVLAAGAPAAESPVPPDALDVPGAAQTRWFGRSTPAAADYAQRWLGARRTGEPMHVGYVERPRLLDAMRAAIAADRPDVVHAFGWGTAGVWRFADGVPVVHVAVDAWSRNAGNRVLPRWRRVTDSGELTRIRAHEQRHYPHEAAVVVVAPPDADAVAAVAPGTRVEIVANCVDAGPEPVSPPPAPVLAFHGTFDARHNIDAARVLVEDVLPLVQESVPDARVLLIGRHPGAEVRRLLGPTVELRADVADARAELRDAAVYVAPLVSGAGLKNKVLEAMAAARPVVTTSLGAAGIGAGDGVRVADSAAAIADDVVALLGDRQRLAEEGVAGRRRVLTEFTWERSAQRIEDLWADVAASAGSL